MKDRNIKYMLGLLFCVIVILPAIQKNRGIFRIPPLKGVYYIKDKPTLTTDTWFSGEYQSDYNKWLEENIGFRNLFVRTYNQVRYSLFKQTNSGGIIIGKNNILYQNLYLNEYKGYTFVGHEKIKEAVKKMSLLQSEFKKQGKLFLYVIAPGKVTYLPEYIPDMYRLHEKGTNNYEVFIKELKRNNINHIDFQELFLKMKDTTSYPLFPKNGIHWSGYSLTLVADTLFNYIEDKSGFSLIDFNCLPGELTSKNLRYTDSDLGDILNLFKIKNFNMYYPNVVFNDDTSSYKPSILTIGDSFNQSFWGFYPFFPKAFSEDSRFWSYYNIEEWEGKRLPNNVPIRDRNLEEMLDNKDIILLMSTQINISKLGYGFVEDAYSLFTDESYVAKQTEEGAIREEKIEKYINEIKENNELLEEVHKQAIERNKSLSEMIRLNAIWLVEHESKPENE